MLIPNENPEFLFQTSTFARSWQGEGEEDGYQVITSICHVLIK